MLVFSFRSHSRSAAKLRSAFRGSSGQHSVKCAGSQHTARVERGKGGDVETDNRMSGLLSEVVVALTDSTGRDSNQRQDDRLGDVVKPVSTTLAVLLCQILLQNGFAVAF